MATSSKRKKPEAPKVYPSNQGWTTWVSSSGFGSRIQETAKGYPKGNVGSWTPRPATIVEIVDERARRAESERDRTAREAFQERRDVRDADFVRSMIEMYMEDVVDRLSPKEWKALADKLSVNGTRQESPAEEN